MGQKHNAEDTAFLESLVFLECKLKLAATPPLLNHLNNTKWAYYFFWVNLLLLTTFRFYYFIYNKKTVFDGWLKYSKADVYRPYDKIQIC